MTMTALIDRVAIVTGASGGLGARFASVLADAGAQVLAAARRVDRLEELARSQPSLHPVQCDVTVDGDRERLGAAAVERVGRIDVCVSNAGLPCGGGGRSSTPARGRP